MTTKFYHHTCTIIAIPVWVARTVICLTHYWEMMLYGIVLLVLLKNFKFCQKNKHLNQHPEQQSSCFILLLTAETKGFAWITQIKTYVN